MGDAMSIAQAESVARRITSWTEEERKEAETPLGRSDPKRSVDLMDDYGSIVE